MAIFSMMEHVNFSLGTLYCSYQSCKRSKTYTTLTKIWYNVAKPVATGYKKNDIVFYSNSKWGNLVKICKR